jgi:hypothetical protein
MTERQIELVWRCSSCQHQNLGRHTLCQSCGNPKDDSEAYEMPVDPAVVASVAWSAYKVPEWVKSPSRELTGDDVTPRWPDAGVAERDGGPSAEPKLGEKRVTRTETFAVTLRTDDGATHQYVPASAEELARLAPATQHEVRVKNGQLSFAGAR